MGYTMLLIQDQEWARTSLVEEWGRRLAAALPDVQVRVAHTPAEAETLLPQAQGAYGYIPPELFPRARQLRWLACPQAGPNPRFYHTALIESDVVVTNTRAIYNDHISAHILTMVLAFARGLPTYLAQQARREWRKEVPRLYLPETTAVIVGVGGIGAETARLCAAFGMRVIGVDPRIEAPPPGVAALLRPELLHEALPQADFVILTAPETPQTRGLFGTAQFALMRRSAYFINIGRGATVRLAALDAALRSGQIAGAALDVFETEPLPAQHPLWDAPGVIVTPHVATIGPHIDERRYSLLLENCRRFNAGEPLLNVVDKRNWF